MINLSIGKTTDTNGATLYTLTPSPVVLGNQNANAVDEVQVAGIPAEWDGLTIRAVFVPTPGAAVACILDENGRCTVSASFTGNRGEIVVDAFGEDYHAYTTPARYAVARHQDISATVDPEYTPTQVEQILAQAQTYANDAQDARDDAQGYAEDAAASAAEIEDMTVSAQTLPAGSAATVTKTETQTGINLDFGLPRGADGQVQDVQINGASIVEDGVADIPKATQNAWGLFKPYSGYGIAAIPQGAYVTKANNPQIDGRETNYCPIVPTNLDYAVKAALTDGVGTAYTDAEKAAARARIGVENATNTTWGLFKPYGVNAGDYGLYCYNGGAVIDKASDWNIDNRNNDFKPLVSKNLDYAVKAAMTDGRGAAWTAAEQLAGRQRLGMGNYELIYTETLTADTNEKFITLGVGKSSYRVVVTSPTSPTNYSLYYRVLDSNSAGLLTINLLSVHTNGAVSRVDIYDDYGYLQELGHSFSNINIVSSSQVGQFTQNMYAMCNNVPFDNTMEYKLRIFTNPNTNMILNGTNIKIYAR